MIAFILKNRDYWLEGLDMTYKNSYLYEFNTNTEYKRRLILNVLTLISWEIEDTRLAYDNRRTFGKAWIKMKIKHHQKPNKIWLIRTLLKENFVKWRSKGNQFHITWQELSICIYILNKKEGFRFATNDNFLLSRLRQNFSHLWLFCHFIC